MKKLSVFVLLILPAVLAFTAGILHYAQGPYWLGSNVDPEYLYVLSSLTLAESKQTDTTGNPGTTLQMLGAATMKISHALDFSGKDSLEFAVLKNPEFYLTVMNALLVTFNTLLLFFIGLTAFTLTKNIWLSLLVQFSPFFSKNILIDGLPRVSPEPLLLFSSLLFVLILMRMVLSKNLLKSAHLYMIILALVSGFGVATKLTFLPLLIIPLFALPKLRNKIGFLFLTVFSFVLWTWPIISLYENLFNWYYRILTHTGYYGSGGSRIIYLEAYFQNIMNLFLGNPLFFLVWLSSTGFIMIFRWTSLGGEKAKRKAVWQDNILRILASLTVAQLLAVMMVAKHPAGWYLIPALGLSGLMLFLMLLYLQRLGYFNRFHSKKVVLFAGIIFISVTAWGMVDIKNVFMQNLQIKQESLAVYGKVESEYKDYHKFYQVFLSSYLASSSPVCALAFGNYFVNEGRYSGSLQKIYGDVYFYNALNKKFYNWTREFSMENFILEGHGSKIVFQFPSIPEYGDRIICKRGSILHLKDVFKGQPETIYILDGITLMREENKETADPVSPFPDLSNVFK
ncbi:MAG: hypothetical protein CVU55_05010 [Deltaproteobacteria bacterium HGW-Deltaproteobacteria-13]|nr:MAG: hypothetical protein CVU55_05010 [Deltaproteobacteria bacterium HGW-Deltaproteobacteria-13]